MSAADARARLAAAQAELVRSLSGQLVVPADFNLARVAAAAAALANKRARAVARVWPSLTAALGERFHERFAAFAQEAALPAEGGPLADGRAFARFLSQAGELPDAGRLEAIGVDLRFRHTPNGLLPRRGASAVLAVMYHGRLIVGVRFPRWGEWWLRLPWSQRRF